MEHPGRSGGPTMKSVEIPTTDPQELLEQMSHLVGEEERRRFFERRPDLVRPEQVESICTEVARQVRIDAERAIELAATGRYLAERLDDDASRALSARAAANALHFSGDYALSQELYQEALDLFERLGDEHSAAITRSSALYNLAYLGEYAKVYEWEQDARRVFDQDDDRLRLAILDHNVANVLHRQARYREAMDRYLAAHDEFQRLDRAEDAAVCLNNVATCHVDQHRPEHALAIYEKSRAYCEEQGLAQLVMEVDYNVACLSYLRAEYTRAIRLFRVAKEEAEGLGDDYQKALCDLDLSELYLELNLVEETIGLAGSAHDGFDRLKMPYESAKALTHQALALDRRGKTKEALDLLRRARKIFVQEQNRIWPAQIDYYRAMVLQHAGRPEEALQAAESALTVFETPGLESRAVMCDLLLARSHLEMEALDRARAACIRAEKRLEQLELPALEHESLEVRAQVEEAGGCVERALATYERCDVWLERIRRRLRGESLRIAFLRDKRQIYESLVWLTSRNVAGADRSTRVLRWIEKAKSRGLTELLAFRADEIPVGETGNGVLAERVRRLREELTWLYRQTDLRQMRDDGDVQRDVRALQEKARRKEDELLRAQRELDAQDDARRPEGIKPAIDPNVEPEALCAGLDETTVLVDYFVARGTIFAAVLDRSGVELVEIGRAEMARKVHRLLQFQLSRAGEGSSPFMAKLAARATRDHLRALHAELIDPLEARISDRRLVISPHDFLHYVPFHALLDAEGEAVIDRRPVTYAPSAGVHHFCARQEPGASAGALVLGVADELAPQILAEVRAVAGTLQRAGTETLLFEGEAASEEALRENGLGRRFVHLATHGVFRRDNPMFSAIQLGTSRLSLFDLYGLRLDAELAVLSGCGTGLAAVHGADELVGLTRGLLYAGARSVLVSLWNVHDESTAELMGRFYGHLVAGADPADALRETLKEHREAYPDPYFWAPFVLVGA